MATVTAQDVVLRALRRLNMVALGADAPADLYEDALEEYKVFHEWLRQEFGSRLSWSYDAVDDRYWTHVSAMLAGELSSLFSVGAGSRERAERGAVMSERRLREQLARKRTDTTEITYF